VRYRADERLLILVQQLAHLLNSERLGLLTECFLTLALVEKCAAVREIASRDRTVISMAPVAPINDLDATLAVPAKRAFLVT